MAAPFSSNGGYESDTTEYSDNEDFVSLQTPSVDSLGHLAPAVVPAAAVPAAVVPAAVVPAAAVPAAVVPAALAVPNAFGALGPPQLLAESDVLWWIFALGFQGHSEEAQLFCEEMEQSHDRDAAQLFWDSFLYHLPSLFGQYQNYVHHQNPHNVLSDFSLLKLAFSPETLYDTLSLLLKRSPLRQPILGHIMFGSLEHARVLSRLPPLAISARHALKNCGLHSYPIEELFDIRDIRRWNPFL